MSEPGDSSLSPASATVTAVSDSDVNDKVEKAEEMATSAGTNKRSIDNSVDITQQNQSVVESASKDDGPNAVADQKPSVQGPAVHEPDGPQLVLTLLLITGLRITIKLDSHYMASHSLEFQGPEQVTIGSFKECIYSSWQEDWGPVPTNPANVRLIYLGKVLESSQTFEECKILIDNPYNVLHLSVRPESFELESTEKTKQVRSRFRARGTGESGETRSGGCCIIL